MARAVAIEEEDRMLRQHPDGEAEAHPILEGEDVYGPGYVPYMHHGPRILAQTATEAAIRRDIQQDR
jgi:hypothetical protein